jgi:hypothetical protein
MSFNAQFVRFCRDAGFQVQSYSGRGMYGKKCMAVTADHPATAMIEIIAAANESPGFDCTAMRELLGAMRDVRQDSLGLQSVLYWPSITPPTLEEYALYDLDEDDYEDDEDDDEFVADEVARVTARVAARRRS